MTMPTAGECCLEIIQAQVYTGAHRCPAAARGVEALGVPVTTAVTAITLGCC